MNISIAGTAAANTLPLILSYVVILIPLSPVLVDGQWFLRSGTSADYINRLIQIPLVEPPANSPSTENSLSRGIDDYGNVFRWSVRWAT
jgi:hypothetical protein